MVVEDTGPRYTNRWRSRSGRTSSSSKSSRRWRRRTSHTAPAGPRGGYFPGSGAGAGGWISRSMAASCRPICVGDSGRISVEPRRAPILMRKP